MPTTPEPRTCLFCGEEYTPKRKWQKFCTPEHQQAFWARAREISSQIVSGQITVTTPGVVK